MPEKYVKSMFLLRIATGAMVILTVAPTCVVLAQSSEFDIGARPFADTVARITADTLPAIAVREWVGVYKDPLASSSSIKAMLGIVPDQRSSLRGAQAVLLFRRISPAVVLVVSKEGGLGSGSLLTNDGDVLTNWHVVMGQTQVGVIFKPSVEGANPTRAELRRAKVVRIDEVADLALLKVETIPTGVTPLTLGSMSDVEVGADVHAIGHPTGEAWTYTMGVVSQLRRDYKWTGETKKAHQATVIQTQTPINPGNSGGPLFTDAGHLVGVNSFKSQGEGLNFAVAVDEVRRFLAMKTSRVAERANTAASADTCEPREVSRGRSKRNDMNIVAFDLDCSGRVNAEIRIPDNKKLPILAVIDRNGDGKPDIIIFDLKRKLRWDISLHDSSFDQTWNIVGHHPDGKIVATWFEQYSIYVAKGGVPLK